MVAGLSGFSMSIVTPSFPPKKWHLSLKLTANRPENRPFDPKKEAWIVSQAPFFRGYVSSSESKPKVGVKMIHESILDGHTGRALKDGRDSAFRDPARMA